MESGQFSFAPLAACSKPSASSPGTLPVTVSAILVIPKPSPTWSTVTFASVASESGGLPACVRPTDNAIVKHDA